MYAISVGIIISFWKIYYRFYSANKKDIFLSVFWMKKYVNKWLVITIFKYNTNQVNSHGNFVQKHL